MSVSGSAPHQTVPTATPTPAPTAQSTPTATPVQFAIKARWEKYKSKPALNGAALKSSKVGKSVQVDIYLVVQSAAPSAPVSYYVEVRFNGKKVASATDDEQLDSTDPTGWYPNPFSYKPKKAGKYTIRTQVTIGDKVVNAKSGTLTVK
jgi:hypothetical protein